MSAKKQIADIENTIMLFEEKIERLEEEHVTMKQMISMQNALIDNLQMMVKMMALVPAKHQVVHIGGNDVETNTSGGQVISQELNKDNINTNEQQQNKKLKQRMARVF